MHRVEIYDIPGKKVQNKRRKNKKRKKEKNLKKNKKGKRKMNKNNKMFRQGDVLIVRIGDAPKVPDTKELPLTKMGPVLALGEVTGHHHTVVAHPEIYNPVHDLPDLYSQEIGKTIAAHAQHILDEMIFKNNAAARNQKAEPACRLYQDEDSADRTLVVFRKTLLRHEEHPAIFLDEGIYKIKKQQEFTPQGWRDVQD